MPAATVDNCLQLSIYAEAVGTPSPLKLPSLDKTRSTRPSLSVNLVKKPIPVVALAFDLSVLYLRTGWGGGGGCTLGVPTGGKCPCLVTEEGVCGLTCAGIQMISHEKKSVGSRYEEFRVCREFVSSPEEEALSSPEEGDC